MTVLTVGSRTGAITHSHAATTLASVTATLRAMFGTDQLPGLAPHLIVDDETGWTPLTRLIEGEAIPSLLATAVRRWNAKPHAAAALLWKSYSYYATLPVVLGWATARRIPLLEPAHVLVRGEAAGPLVTIGLCRGVRVAVLPSDPLASTGWTDVQVVRDEAELLAVLRASLLDRHLNPLVDVIRERVRISARTLLGSVSSAVAYAVLRAADHLPGSPVTSIGTLLDALDLADLVELVPGPTGEPTVRRKTCCLAFTLPKPKVCAGCCVRPS